MGTLPTREQFGGLTDVSGDHKLSAARHSRCDASELLGQRVLLPELKETVFASTCELAHHTGLVECDEDVRVGQLTNTRPHILQERGWHDGD